MVISLKKSSNILVLTALILILLFNLALQIPKITIPTHSYSSVPTDTTGCVYNGNTWTNKSGQVWDGNQWK
jgi:hypothetical protein